MTKNHPQPIGPRLLLPAMIGALLVSVAFVIPAARASEPPAEAPISSVPPLLLEHFSIFGTPPEVDPLRSPKP